MLGFHGADVERGSLDVRSLWRREHPLGSIEKIVFRTEPEVDVPAYVCPVKTAAVTRSSGTGDSRTLFDTVQQWWYIVT